MTAPRPIARVRPAPPEAREIVPAAQIATGHVERAEWDDPDDKRTAGSRTVRQVAGFRRADPLVTLHKRSPRDFTLAHLRAAERLRDDYEMSEGALVRPGHGNGDMGIINAQMAAAARYRAAVASVGATAWTILRLVVLDGWTLAQMAGKFHPDIVRSAGELKARRWLVVSLDALDLHYNPPRRADRS